MLSLPKCCRTWLILSLSCVPLLLVVGRASDDIPASRARILEDVKFLSQDDRMGRGVGTKGLDDAAEYIRTQFQKAGLQPGMPDGTFFQSFEMPNGSVLGEPNWLAFEHADGKKMELEFKQSFVPASISGPGKIRGGVAFVGYGITAPRANYDDYDGIDVRDKVVVVMGRGPRQSAEADQKSDPHAAIGSRQMDLRQKAANAASHGAAAMLFVHDPQFTKDHPDRLMEFGELSDFRVAKIPVAQLTQDVANEILKTAGQKSLAELQSAIDADMKPHSIVLPGWTGTGEIQVTQKYASVRNVLGAVRGEGPLADQYVVIGAHYDHLGLGEVGSMAPGSKEIHNGADDNASGTSGVLELARRFAGRRQPLPRSLLFVTFTGEERGLIGSDHYVKSPAVPLEQTVAMVNLDMIGRLRNEKLIVEGVGTAAEFRPLVESLGSERGFNIKAVAAGMGPSDQTSFCLKHVPVLFFWTDYHADYHKPSDDWEKIATDGLDRIVGLVEEVVLRVASAETRPQFINVPAPSPVAGQGDSGGERAYLGTIPAFGEEGEGVLLSGVTSGSPADKAGIAGGDAIVQIGTLQVGNLQDMQTALESHRPGDTIKVTVRRGTLRITYPVTLGRRKN